MVSSRRCTISRDSSNSGKAASANNDFFYMSFGRKNLPILNDQFRVIKRVCDT